MQQRRSWTWIAVLLTSLASCVSSNHMTEVPPEQRVVAPEPGKALVVFLRPSSFGGAIQASVFDGKDYIGTVSANTQVPYQASPGEHMFAVIGESADFMKATLDAGKTYYAIVQARMGFWKARFSLRPQNGQISDAEMSDALESTRQVVPNDEGRTWAQNNADSIEQKIAKYRPEWENKPDDQKQILHASSGR